MPEGGGASRTRRTAVGSIVAAAMLLPGVVATTARAEGKPDAASVTLRTLTYKDSQPGLDRISVVSPAFQVVAPLVSDDWWLNGTLVADSVSGATPRYHTAVSGASRMTEKRTAGEVRVMHYLHRVAVGAGVAGSTERDYRSMAASFDLRWSSEDQNTEVALGLGTSDDRINPVNDVVNDETRRTQQLSLAITKVASRTDILQASIAYSDGRGYYSDPYKVLDERPRERRQTVLMLRWNHHFTGGGTTMRSSWRATQDSFGVQSHTVQAEWVVPVSDSVRLLPALRLYTQTAADFYLAPRYDPVLGEPFPVGYDRNNPPRYISLDQRLSSFGAVALGLGAALAVDRDWTIDGKVEAYEQRGRWAWDGNGSQGLAPFRAYSAQIGLTRRF
ncbi:MAG: DUF3570 domain-containing protein [Rubrivivax sp.]|nr:DUF3570 domain-containing protein [Rubrivivax sp.]